MCVFVFMYICIYVYLPICIFAYMYICIYEYMHIYIYVYAYLYMCIRVFIFVGSRGVCLAALRCEAPSHRWRASGSDGCFEGDVGFFGFKARDLMGV